LVNEWNDAHVCARDATRNANQQTDPHAQRRAIDVATMRPPSAVLADWR
jgi:hypothetical protein